jgi:hypothetical protein
VVGDDEDAKMKNGLTAAISFLHSRGEPPFSISRQQILLTILRRR